MRCKLLIQTLSEIPDFRKAKGKRHRLSSILALACVAIMCGARTYTAIADWANNYDRSFIKALGFTHKKTPCIATLHIIFRKIDIKLLEAKLGEWAESTLKQSLRQELGDIADEAVAIDGKTLRGILKQSMESQALDGSKQKQG